MHRPGVCAQLESLLILIRNFLIECGAVPMSQAKTDHSPVTVADIGVQVLINGWIRQRFPRHRIVAEEGSQQCAESLLRECLALLKKSGSDFDEQELRDRLDYRGPSDAPLAWMVDPIDGTKGFLRGGQFAVAFGLFDDFVPRFGCLICPRLGFPSMDSKELGSVLIWEKGGPAYQVDLATLARKRELPVNGVATPVLVRSVSADHGDRSFDDAFKGILGLLTILPLDSQVKYALLCRREASVYLRVPRIQGEIEKVWDHGAGAALLTAVGGRVTGIDGLPYDFSLGEALQPGCGVLASIGVDHSRVVAALAEARKH